jgi:DtxR family Mn-dependent transcriptional regulator
MEEYLEIIYRFAQRDGVARTSEIATSLKVVLGTVTNTVERLEKEGLVTHEPYRGVKLTRKGMKQALSAIRRHRLSERLLTDVLGVDWADAHTHACKLEHGICDYVTDRLEATLGNPKTCPHGNPIPSKSGDIEEGESAPLIDASVGEELRIVRIAEDNVVVLHYLGDLGLRPEAALKLVDKTPFEGPLTLNVGGQSHSIGRDMATLIQVRPKSHT